MAVITVIGPVTDAPAQAQDNTAEMPLSKSLENFEDPGARPVLPPLPPRDILRRYEQDAPVPREVANDFYKRCRLHIYEDLTPKSQRSFCACAAARMDQNLTINTLYGLQAPDSRDEWFASFEELIDQVYAPCVIDPVEDVMYFRCVEKRSYDVRIKNVKDYCGCVAAATASIVKDNGAVYMKRTFALEPEHFTDPLEALFKTPALYSSRYRAQIACIDRYSR